MKILIIEDEKDLLNSINDFLLKDGHVCEIADDYFKAEEKIALYKYDIILIDITLPHGNGLELLKLLKEDNPETGTIIISAKDSLDDKLHGLDLGADDYLTKPFHLAELNSRIKAVQRRRKFHGSSKIILC
jgi:DNA-binding response OmpR family regulator